MLSKNPRVVVIRSNEITGIYPNMSSTVHKTAFSTVWLYSTVYAISPKTLQTNTMEGNLNCPQCLKISHKESLAEDWRLQGGSKAPVCSIGGCKVADACRKLFIILVLRKPYRDKYTFSSSEIRIEVNESVQRLTDHWLHDSGWKSSNKSLWHSSTQPKTNSLPFKETQQCYSTKPCWFVLNVRVKHIRQ